MKHVLFLFLLLPVLAFSQQVTRDTAFVRTTAISGVTYYQEVREITYDNGQSSIQTGPRLDSAEFVRRAFRDAHDAMLPVAEGVRILAQAPEQRRTFQYYSNILLQVAGQNYVNGVLQGGKFQNYISAYEAVWRVDYDSSGTQRSFFVFYNDSTNVGLEISNASQVINSTANPAFVPAARRRQIQFLPYETFFAQVQLTLRNAQGQPVAQYQPRVEVREIASVVDDNGIDTGRRIWTSIAQTGRPAPIRLVKIPIRAQ